MIEMNIQANNENILAIDAGNTRVKWGLFNTSGIIIEQGAYLHAELTTAVLPVASRVVISNVAGHTIQAQIKALLPRNATPHWISAQSAACGVSNHYGKPTTLGSDRWAAIIAAWHIKQIPCVVVNAGTAVTIDALCIQPASHKDKAAFIGGLILPGLDLMQQSLGLATAQLPMQASTQQSQLGIFAKNTADAMLAGALHAILGAIDRMACELQQHCKQVPHIVISGGNSNIIKSHLTGDMTEQAVIVDNLVLQGLYLLEKFMQSESP